MDPLRFIISMNDALTVTHRDITYCDVFSFTGQNILGAKNDMKTSLFSLKLIRWCLLFKKVTFNHLGTIARVICCHNSRGCSTKLRKSIFMSTFFYLMHFSMAGFQNNACCAWIPKLFDWIRLIFWLQLFLSGYWTGWNDIWHFLHINSRATHWFYLIFNLEWRVWDLVG